MWKRRSSERRGPTDSEGVPPLCGSDLLVAECESYLTGRYALDLASRDLPVPQWAWLGMLAHAPFALLNAWAIEEPLFERWNTESGRWCHAVARLARELLDTSAAVGEPVEDLQRAVLVQLELDPDAVAQQAATPAQLVSWVLDDLDTFRQGICP